MKKDELVKIVLHWLKTARPDDSDVPSVMVDAILTYLCSLRIIRKEGEMTTPKGWPEKKPLIDKAYSLSYSSDHYKLGYNDGLKECLSVHNALMAEKECEIDKLSLELTCANGRLELCGKEIEKLKEQINELLLSGYGVAEEKRK